MQSKKSIYLIVTISLFVGLLHFVIGPNYQGICKDFIRSYLMDILLPMNLYLLLQIALRKNMSVNYSRMIAAIGTLAFGTAVELLQFNKIELFGRTYDPRDLLMYGIGVGLGILMDLMLLNRFEKQSQ